MSRTPSSDRATNASGRSAVATRSANISNVAIARFSLAAERLEFLYVIHDRRVRPQASGLLRGERVCWARGSEDRLFVYAGTRANCRHHRHRLSQPAAQTEERTPRL